MKGDHLSFKRATNVAILGLVLQTILGSTLLIFAAIWREQAAISTAIFLLCGLPIWLSLAIVFDQHRRERLEALEAESMERSGVAGSSVFQQTGAELRVAARRLAWMHRFMLPGVSLIVAALFVGMGWWRFRVAMLDYQVLTADLPANVPHDMPIAIGLTLGVIGFIFARFVAGMAKQKIWANLRAGGAQAVGGAVMGLGIAAAHFAFLAGSDVVFRYTQVIFPWILIILGAEMVLNFVLTIYRPRRTGEIPRPAFDSRILGFLAAPDKLAESIGGALNYQFGFDVTGSWFYQLLSRSILMLIAVGALVLWGMTFFAVVHPGEQGLRLRNGALIGGPLEPRLYFKLPWPIEEIEQKQTTSLHRLDLGSPPPGDVKSLLWTTSHKIIEKYMLVRPSDSDMGADAAGTLSDATSDQIKDIVLVTVEVPVFYVVSDLLKFEQLAQDGMRDSYLRAMGQQVVTKYLATQKMDDILGSGRTRAATELRELIVKRFEEADAGVDVRFVGIAGVHPPTTTAAMFESVVESLQQREGNIESARKDETDILTQAVGSVALAKEIAAELKLLEDMKKSRVVSETDLVKQQLKIEDLLASAGGQAAVAIQKAKADRWKKHMTARGRADRYQGQLAAYRAAPQVYLSQLYFDSLRAILKDARIYITPDDSGAPVEVRVDAQDKLDMSNAFKSMTKPQE